MYLTIHFKNKKYFNECKLREINDDFHKRMIPDDRTILILEVTEMYT